MKSRHITRNLIIAILAATPVTAAQAANVKVDATVTYVTVSNDSSKLSDGRTVMRLHQKGIIRASDAKSPFNFNSQDCVGTVVVGKDGKSAQAAGYCDAIDKDGDVWWLWWSDSAAGNPWGVISGTGKYEGMTGGGTTLTDVQLPDGSVSITVKGDVVLK
jgi:hypothetical protein